jgi:site-specific DNA-methyltransferase (adenine-specific)
VKPYYEDDRVTLYNGDCREIMPELSTVDLIVTDPPYSFGMASTFHEGKNGGWGDMMNAASFYALILEQCYRVTENRQGAVWMFNSWRSLPILARAAFEARWPITSLLVWDKQWIGPGGQQGLRPSYELVALFAHSVFSLENRGLPDIWPCQWSSQRPNDHPAEKPVALVERIIRESLTPADCCKTVGHTVLDPFAGSGTTLRAALNLGHKAVGIEIEERYCEIAAKRMSQSVMELDMSDRIVK